LEAELEAAREERQFWYVFLYPLLSVYLVTFLPQCFSERSQHPNPLTLKGTLLFTSALPQLPTSLWLKDTAPPSQTPHSGKHEWLSHNQLASAKTLIDSPKADMKAEKETQRKDDARTRPAEQEVESLKMLYGIEVDEFKVQRLNDLESFL
jgi:hypothetical protein